MNREQLVAAMAAALGESPGRMDQFVETFVTVVRQRVAMGEDVYVRGFGRWVTKRVAARMIQLPRTANGPHGKAKYKILVAAHVVVKFEGDGVFSQAVMGGHGSGSAPFTFMQYWSVAAGRWLPV